MQDCSNSSALALELQQSCTNKTGEVLLKDIRFTICMTGYFKKSCLLSLSRKTTSLERPVVPLYRFHYDVVVTKFCTCHNCYCLDKCIILWQSVCKELSWTKTKMLLNSKDCQWNKPLHSIAKTFELHICCFNLSRWDLCTFYCKTICGFMDDLKVFRIFSVIYILDF